MAETISDRMADCNNRPAGFDYMRIMLALSVVSCHAINVSFGRGVATHVWQGPFRPLLAIILPMFFCLSGFLVAGSLERCRSMISFVGLRIVRLVPALAVDTLIAAFILGPIFTTLPLHSYFSDPLFPRYFINILGHPQYLLPGVFAANPFPSVVNDQLWALPYELLCYFALVVLALIGVVRSRRLFLLTVCALVAAIVLLFASGTLTRPPGANTVTKIVLLETFLLGVAFYLYRDRIRMHFGVFVIALIAAILLLAHPQDDPVAAFPITYVTVYLGLLNPRRIDLLMTGDYSYGVYLYGFPIQQAVVSLFGPHRWYLALALALTIIAPLAAFSWWCVEKPALRLRPYLYALEARMIGWIGRLPLGTHMVRPPLGPRLPPRASRTIAGAGIEKGAGVP